MAYLKPNELSVLLVTYSDRRKFLKKALESLVLISKYISNVTIVQNGADYNIENFLKGLSLGSLDINCVTNKMNLGSAGGFGSGIKVALQSPGGKIIIFDDDNYLPEDSFKALQKLNPDQIKNIYGSKVAISLYRPSHDQDNTKFKRDFDWNSKYFENSVYQFSIKHKLNLYKSKEKRKLREVAESYVVPYSGLIVEKTFLKNVEPVQTNYFVYGDDTRLTARLSESGVKILSWQNIIAIDMEESWYQSKDEVISKKNDIRLMLETGDVAQLWRPFYRIRNGVNNSKHVFKKGNFSYWINFLIFITVPFFAYMPKNKTGLKNYRYFLRAVFNGQRDKLGKIDNKKFF